jgi:hypothetical protein
MISMRVYGVAVVAAATLALPAAATATAADPVTSGSSSAGPAPTINLREPETLPVGDPPHAAYITGVREGPIYRPGKSSLATGPGGGEQFLASARGGFLLTVGNRVVRYVSDTGLRHDVFRVPGSRSRYVDDTVVSHDGRYVAITVRSTADAHYDRVDVVRIARPTTIAHRRFSVPVIVASLTARRALLTPDALAYRPHRLPMPTRWWNLHTGTLRIFDSAGRPGPRSDFSGQSAADLTAGQVALLRGDHNRVVTIPRRPARAWNTRSHEWVVSWSPDDRYVLTASWTPQQPRIGNQWDTLAIRRARDGQLITLFTGYQNLYGNSWTPVWEDSTTFVVDAEDTCDHGSCANTTDVRCTIHGPCQRVELVGLPIGFDSVDERRLPSS